MFASDAATSRHLVVFSERRIHRDREVRDRSDELPPERHKAFDAASRRFAEAIDQHIGMQHLVDRAFALLVPDLLKPSMDQDFIGGWHALDSPNAGDAAPALGKSMRAPFRLRANDSFSVQGRFPAIIAREGLDARNTIWRKLFRLIPQLAICVNR
jgi:hypothetical protein